MSIEPLRFLRVIDAMSKIRWASSVLNRSSHISTGTPADPAYILGKAHYLLRLWPDGPIQVFRQTHHDPGHLELADELRYLGDVFSPGASCAVDFQRLRYGAARVGKSDAYPFCSHI